LKTRTLILAAIAAAVVVTVLATGGRPPANPAADAAAKVNATTERRAPNAPASQGPAWRLSPRASETVPPAHAPFASGAIVPAEAGPELAYAPATLPDRIATLARQVDSGSGGDPYELFSMLNECALAPHRLAMSPGCGTAGDCGPSQQRLARYQETFAACNRLPPDLIGRRQQYLDLAASRGDPRAALVRQQPR
jgi:hypothetical protein